jgi:hypothetical protein
MPDDVSRTSVAAQSLCQLDPTTGRCIVYTDEDPVVTGTNAVDDYGNGMGGTPTDEISCYHPAASQTKIVCSGGFSVPVFGGTYVRCEIDYSTSVDDDGNVVYHVESVTCQSGVR